jgi:uncharacterized cupin superfamily protein
MNQGLPTDRGIRVLPAQPSEGWTDITLNTVDGDPGARAVFLTQEGTGGRAHLSGVYTVEPSVVASQIAMDESLLVLEGEARLEFDDGSSVRIGVGDMVFLPGGTRLTWHYLTPFKEVFFATTYQLAEEHPNPEPLATTTPQLKEQ